MSRLVSFVNSSDSGSGNSIAQNTASLSLARSLAPSFSVCNKMKIAYHIIVAFLLEKMTRTSAATPMTTTTTSLIDTEHEKKREREEENEKLSYNAQEMTMCYDE